MPKEKKEISMPSKKNNIVYENWKVYSMHHKLMFRCNEKKAQWYLTKDLAAILPLESRSIKLNFEAKGDGHKQGDYMIEDRSNTCVACGGHEHLTIHHVVPEMYRHWMPLVIKSKSSRDLLLVCKHCHGNYEDKAMEFKKEGVKRFGIPLEGRGWINLPEHKKAKKAASALIRCSDKIPQTRQQVLKDIVLDFWKTYDEDNERDFEKILEKCNLLQDHYKGPDYIEHGNWAIQQLTKKRVLDDRNQETWPDLETFIKEWRQHFLDHMKPSNLSERWTVDGEIYTTR